MCAGLPASVPRNPPFVKRVLHSASSKKQGTEPIPTLAIEFRDDFRAGKGGQELHNRGLKEQIHPPAARTLRVYGVPR